jgi:hypothetical protein
MDINPFISPTGSQPPLAAFLIFLNNSCLFLIYTRYFEGYDLFPEKDGLS